MSKMKDNYFTYGSAELNQDAFLLWLFNNTDKDIRNVAVKLIRLLTKIDPKETITITKASGQVQNMDIVVEFSSNGDDRVLVIEDKTRSYVHDNQLDTYNDVIDSDYKNKQKKYKVFYKTWIVEDKECQKVNNADWRIFTINEIADFFEKNNEPDNYLLKSYRDYVIYLREALGAGKITSQSIDGDSPEWYGFLKQIKDAYNQARKGYADIDRYNNYFFLFITANEGSDIYHSKYLEICPESVKDNKVKLFFKLSTKNKNNAKDIDKLRLEQRNRNDMQKYRDSVKKHSEQNKLSFVPKGREQTVGWYDVDNSDTTTIAEQIKGIVTLLICKKIL